MVLYKFLKQGNGTLLNSLYFPLRLTRSPLGKVAGEVAFYSHFPDRKSVPTSAEKFRSGPATRRQTSLPHQK